MLTTTQILDLAASHLDNGAVMASSARLCHEDAVKLAAEGFDDFAQDHALRSLAYSVGILHPDHAAVAASILERKRSAP